MSAPQGAQAVAQVAKGAAPYWRNAGMTYLAYVNACSAHVRNCLKEPFKSQSASREQIHYKFTEWDNGVPSKPVLRSSNPEE
ncbi:hypothetical protein R1sor_002984 [Riccia sorocarpa]|uniref:ATP synthase subunit epsilon, mitochondrial n=1 Tax=Riccia sorocarpa TaxID=122646 RepID=A0ABD3H0B6_9MARC